MRQRAAVNGRTKRLDLGLLQRQVEIGVDECAIYNWETNRVAPAVRLIPKIILLPICARFAYLSTAQAHSSELGLLTREDG